MSVDSQGTASTAPPESEEGHGHRNLGLALVLISAAQLMVVLDGTVVNIALPHIQHDLGFTVSNLTWVVTAYAIAFGGLLLLGGRMGDLLGRRKVFMTGVLVFALASLLGGLAQTEWQMLAARSLQGLGAAAASPTALALITTTFPAGPPRNRAFAVYAAMSGAGAAVGLILGGALTEASWRWTMLINVPIGVLVAVLAPRFLGESKPQPGRFDLPGALTATLGLVGIVYGFAHKGQVADATTGTLNSWSSFGTWAPITAGVLLLCAFFLIESRSPHSLLPLHIVTSRTRGVSFLVMLAVGASMFAMFYFLSQFIQNVMEYSSIKAGVAFLPFSVGIVVAAQIASTLINRVDPRWISGVGGLLAASGIFLFSRLEHTSTYWHDLLPGVLLTSAGMGLLFVPLTLTAVSGVDAKNSGVGSAVLNTVQQVGGAVGIAVLGTVFANGYADKFTSLAAAGPQSGQPTSANGITLSQQIAQTAGQSAAFHVAVVMLLAAAVVTFGGLSIRHEDLATDGVAAPVA